MENPYFHQRKIAMINLRIHHPEQLARAIGKLGGTVVTDLSQATLIIYNDISSIDRALLEKKYPQATLQWEGKLDDLVQELENGIEDLY